MMGVGAWVDVVSRARGLGVRLLSRADLVGLSRAESLEALARSLARHHRGSAGARSPVPLGRQVRRFHAAMLATLARWAGRREGHLAVLFLDEDRRSLQAISRHVLAGRPADAALSGLVPTRALPERALSTLAEQPDTAQLARLLALWNHPLAGALEPRRHAARLAPAELERHLQRRFLSCALAASRRADRALRDYASRLVDITNAHTLLVAARHPADAAAASYVPGGRVLGVKQFQAARGARDEAAVVAILKQAFVHRPLVAALTERPPRHGAVELAVLGAMLGISRRDALRWPLSTAPIVAFALALRAEAADLRTLIWGIAQGAAPATLESALVTP